MPVLARPSTSGVETSKYAGHMFAIYGCTTPKKSQWLPLTHTSLFYGPNYMFEHLWSQLAALVAKKKQAL